MRLIVYIVTGLGFGWRYYGWRWMIAMPPVVLLLLLVPASAQYTCADVRRAHETYGAAQLQQWAREHKVTPAQRRAAIRCIHGSRRVRRR